jgi:hypothetical protein
MFFVSDGRLSVLMLFSSLNFFCSQSDAGTLLFKDCSEGEFSKFVLFSSSSVSKREYS